MDGPAVADFGCLDYLSYVRERRASPAAKSRARNERRFLMSECMRLCTPVAGMIIWGEHPLCVNLDTIIGR